MHSLIDNNSELNINNLFVTGINYRQASVQERSLFTIAEDTSKKILAAAKEKGIRSLIVLSTCNRTELYSYSYKKEDLISLLFEFTNGTQGIFQEKGFIKKGEKALKYLFKVASGLDSQILGDFEILGQLKNAVALSRKYDMLGPVMNRLLNFTLQASKSVRTNTELSSGIVSVSYAAIEWLKKIKNLKDKKILLFGTGKFGKNIAKNLKHYLPAACVTVINRTDDTARLLADSLSFNWKSFSSLKEEVNNSDIIILSTSSSEYTLQADFFSGEKEQWVLDLSIPENIAPQIRHIPGIHISSVDEVSKEMEKTFARRKNEVPKALAILEQYQLDFYDWLKLQHHVPVINDIKDKLFTIGEIHFSAITGDKYNSKMAVLDSRVKKTVGSFARNLRYKKEKGCHYISAINEFLQPEVTNE